MFKNFIPFTFFRIDDYQLRISKSATKLFELLGIDTTQKNLEKTQTKLMNRLTSIQISPFKVNILF